MDLRPSGKQRQRQENPFHRLRFPKLHLILAHIFCKVLYGSVRVSKLRSYFSSIPKLFVGVRVFGGCNGAESLLSFRQRGISTKYRKLDPR